MLTRWLFFSNSWLLNKQTDSSDIHHKTNTGNHKVAKIAASQIFIYFFCASLVIKIIFNDSKLDLIFTVNSFSLLFWQERLSITIFFFSFSSLVASLTCFYYFLFLFFFSFFLFLYIYIYIIVCDLRFFTRIYFSEIFILIILIQICLSYCTQLT